MKIVVLIVLSLISINQSFAAQTEYKTIESVIEAFDQSIQSKDKERFQNLFVDPSSTMVAVVSEEGMVVRREMVEKINKQDNKNFTATRNWKSSPQKMIDRIINQEESSREQFDNIKITTDNNIAQVYFDYTYYIGDKKNNWGNESWQLVQTLKGWKISSIVYSITFAK